MILVLLIGILFVGVAAALFARTLLLTRAQAAEGLRQIEAYGFAAQERKRRPSPLRRRRLRLRSGLDALAGSVGAVLSGHVRGLSEENLRRMLLAAGHYSLPPRRFVGYQALATLALGIAWLWLTIPSGTSPLLIVVGEIVALLGGWTLPMLYLRRRAQSRSERIAYEMPELIDTLVATVEAGVAFSASLQIASRRFRGPLGDELRLTLQEQSMGLGLNEALAHMAERCDSPSVRSFVRSLIQGEQLGVSVGQTLRGLAHEMRTRRRQMAEEKAQKAPVKIVFPLVFFIFPSLLIVILGPAALRIREVFS
jgi:tight adherence protein C